MKIVYVVPNEKPIVMNIGNNLQTYQNLVGGYIEVVYPFDDNAVLVCNDEGKFNGSAFNRYLMIDGRPYDAIMGAFFIIGDDGEGDFTSLTDEQIKKYTEMYSDIPEFDRPDLAEPRIGFITW